MAHRECSLILERRTWTWPLPSIVWLRSGTNMKVENLRSVPTWYKIRWPWSSTAVPFPSVSLAHDVPCSTLGRTVNELEWALHNPLVWVIDSIVSFKRKLGVWDAAHKIWFGNIWDAEHKTWRGKAWTEGSRMLTILTMFLRFIRA